MSPRPCPRGRADAGSQLQIQNYVNWWPGELSRRVLDAFMLTRFGAGLCWVSPLETDDFAEYRDEAFLRALGVEQLADRLRRFWPANGPCWDALAVVRTGGDLARWGALLVEAKSHLSELRGDGCGAGPRSRQKIEAALRETKRWLGVPQDVDWTGDLYQYANRLAHLYFFIREGIPVWLVNVYFLGDRYFSDSRATPEEWQGDLAQLKADLGLTAPFIAHAADVFLPVWEPPASGAATGSPTASE